MGHQVLAGEISRDENFGMVRIDVPGTENNPPFTRLVGQAAIFGITFVSEQAARSVAAQHAHRVISELVPDYAEMRRLQAENVRMRRVVQEMTTGLPEPVRGDYHDPRD